MKKNLLTLLLISGTFQSQSSEWKVNNADDCGEKIVIKAEQGNPYVTLRRGSEELKLYGKNGALFYEDAISQVEFSSLPGKKIEYTFIYPGYVDGNPPKIDLIQDLKIKRCRLELSR